MDIEEIRAAKEALEEEIRDFLRPKFQAFAEETGCPIDSICVGLGHFHTMGDRIGTSAVTGVTLQLRTGL